MTTDLSEAAEKGAGMGHGIHILGASGSGTTTLGEALAETLGCHHYDTDDYFWLPTDPPFQQKRPAEQRLALLDHALSAADDWLLSGSLCGWGDVFIPRFTHVVFLWLPQEIRMERLRQREQLRFGTAVLPGGERHEAYLRFLDWAAGYDEGGLEIRSRMLHEQWLNDFSCPLLRFEGVYSLEETTALLLQHIGLDPTLEI